MARPGTLATASALALLAATGAAWAQNDQFVLLDTPYIHNTTTKAFSFFPLAPGVPDNWRTPVNYAEGTIYMRLEVLSKPSTRGVNYQICIFQDQHSAPKHACARYQYFTAPGLYTWSQAMTGMFQYGNLDWTRRMLDLMLVVKDRGGNPVDDRFGFGGLWDGSPDFSLYYPMEVKFTAIVVAKGATFAPPSGWTTPGGSTAPPPPGSSPPPPGSVTNPPNGDDHTSLGEGENGDRWPNDTLCGGAVAARAPRAGLLVLALGLALVLFAVR
jgi:hypothetical protein